MRKIWRNKADMTYGNQQPFTSSATVTRVSCVPLNNNFSRKTSYRFDLEFKRLKQIIDIYKPSVYVSMLLNTPISSSVLFKSYL